MKQEVSCKVTSSIISYVRREKKNLARLLEGIELSEEHLQDTNSWVSLDLVETLFERLEEIFYDDQIVYKVATEASRLESWGVLDSVFRMIGEPRLIYHQARKFCSYFYKTIDVRTLEKSDFHIVLKFSPKKLSKRHLQYLQGAFESIPKYWNMGGAYAQKIDETTFEFRWENKQLFFGKKDTTVSLSPHLIQDTIFQLEKTNALIEKKNRELQEKNEELISANRKLKETIDEKIQAEKMASIGQLATGVAHEINNPLSFIISNLGRVREYVGKMMKMLDEYDQMIHQIEGKEKEENKRICEKIKDIRKVSEIDYVIDDFPLLIAESQEGLNRVHSIIKDLNSFARVAPEEMEYVDIHEGIDATLNLLRYELKRKAVVRKNYGQLPKVRCNLPRLNQVFLNILLNACQAIKEKGEIKIETFQENDQVMISFFDSGQGIDPKSMSQIFEPFFTTKKPGQNMGLGLSTALGIVRNHLGDIRVESILNEGTRFVVYLPIQGVIQGTVSETESLSASKSLA